MSDELTNLSEDVDYEQMVVSMPSSISARWK